MSRSYRLAAAFLGTTLVAIAGPAEAQVAPIQGQIQINGRAFRIQQGQAVPVQDPAAEGDEATANIDGVFLPPDRNAKRRLDSARELLEEKRYGEGVRYLGSLLEGNEDYFFRPDPAEQVFRSLKSEAGRLLGELPKEGRESYELQFGARARKMLDEAVAARDIDGVAEVSRRFFYTQAGAEATLLLGKQFWVQGEPLAAALCMNRLRELPESSRYEPMLSLISAASWQQSGDSRRALEILNDLKARTPRAEVQIGGASVPLFGHESQALAWLEQQVGPMSRAVHTLAGEWTMFRGDSARNAYTTGSLPLLNPRWRVRCADHPKVADAITQLERAYRDQGIAALPTSHPLAVGNVVLMRTTRSLLAVDFATGKRLWEPPSRNEDDSLDQLLAASSGRQQLGLPAELLTAIDRRVWGDSPFGTLASDGEYVFAIEDLGFSSRNVNVRQVVGFNGRRQVVGIGPKDYNRLSALELKTEGKLKWEVGGADGEDEPKLAEAFFLGAPLPILGRLYAIVETKGQEIRLVTLNAKTGQLEWSQQLAVVEDGILNDPYRRSAGATPSFADGILVCPTSAGAIVAIDLATRSLRWGFQYPRGGENDMDRMQMFRMRMYNPTEQTGHDAWADASVTLAGGKVLVTPVESNTLYCLSLIDGSVLWKQERGNNLYVAGVHDQNVILVGRRAVTAVKLSDGTPAWSESLDLPGGSSPSGRGFMGNGRYYLPLSSAEVVQIDLTTGKIVSRARSRHGSVPGNLICFHGEVISQGTDYLESFYQLDSLKNDVAERLKANSNDPQAIARLGEIYFDAGDIDAAAAQFRRAYELAPDEMSGELLVETLLEGLRADFTKHRETTAELEKLIKRPAHQLEYLRLLAVGLQKAGEPMAAFEAYLRMADLEEPAPAAAANAESLTPLDEVADGQMVQRDRWLRVRLETLRAAADADTRSKIDALLAERLTKASTDGTAAELQRWIEIGGTHPLVNQCRAALVKRLGGPESMLEREFLLRQLVASKDAEFVPMALFQLAQLYAEARQDRLAAQFYQQLANEWPDTVIHDGKTGRQILDAIASAEIKDALEPRKPWPVGLVEAREDKPKRSLAANRYQRPFDINWTGSRGPYFNDVQFMLDQRQQSLLCLDDVGNERFRITIGDLNSRRNFVPFNTPQLNSVSVNGHLLVYSLGFRLMAFDTLRPSGSPGKPLWTQELSEPLTGTNVNAGVHPRSINIAWGETRYIAADTMGRAIGTPSPVMNDGVVVQRFRDLLCLHPITGKVMWQRRNAPQGCQIFGDEELLIAAPSEGGEALVLSTRDGELLGKCQVVPVEQRMTTLGRNLLTWQADGGRSTMSLVDPWANNTVWSQHFAPNSKAALLDDVVVGVMEPNGKFSLFNIQTGKRLIQEQLEKEKALTSIMLLGSADQYLLVTNSPPRNMDPRFPIQPAPGGLNNPLVNGRVYAFSRESGKTLWPEPVSIQNHGLILSQPSDLPVLFFLRSMQRNLRGVHEMRLSVLAIDKRNGRTVYKNDELRMGISNVEFRGDREDNSISLLLPGKTITFTCTDKPLPPPEEGEKPEVKQSNVGRAVGGMFRALDNAARRISGLPTEEEEDNPFGDQPEAGKAVPGDKEPAVEDAVEPAVEEGAVEVEEVIIVDEPEIEADPFSEEGVLEPVEDAVEAEEDPFE